MKYQSWTNRKIQRLVKCYSAMSDAELLIEFAPHTIGAICRAARRSGARRIKKQPTTAKRRDWAAIAKAYKPIILCVNRVPEILTESANVGSDYRT